MQDSSVTLDDTSIVFLIQTIAQAIFMPVAPFLMRYISPKLLCSIGGIFSIGGVFLSSFITNYTYFIIIYPVLFGLGIGFSYMPPLVIGWEHFPQWRGVVSGLIVGGFGFGSFIFGFVSLAIANPHGEIADLEVPGGLIFGPESEVPKRVPMMLRIN
mmetsp:Transcript_5646/g.4858  ORF Transcript_5646/g.4858 Transcript_5646/m.4858 type:complete len:157 (+) Transcript_5646:115-585(+)